MLEVLGNINYAASIVRVRALDTLDNCDNVVGFPVYGSQAIVGKDTEIGSLAVYFPAESRLSDMYAGTNNLYRDPTQNDDPEQKGYLEANRRVKAIKFRGHRSDALVMPLDSLSAFVDVTTLREGDTFDTIGGVTICEKYVIREPKVHEPKGPKEQREELIDGKYFPLHFDSDNWWRNEHKIGDADNVIVTQKLHGTSVRFGRIPAPRKLRLIERIAKKFGAKVQESEHKFVVGSRKVVKRIGDQDREGVNHCYPSDLWSQVAAEYGAVVPEGYIVYGEIIGWTAEGAPVQRGYTYNVPQGEARLYVYRVATINHNGDLRDLSWPQIVSFCHERGMNVVPLMWEGEKRDFYVDGYMDINYSNDGVPGVVPLPESVVDEGVVIRADYGQPMFLKAKSPIFLFGESKMLDEGVEDLESAEAESVTA